jgi:hypothetical protein
MTPCHVEVKTRAVNMTPRHVNVKLRPVPIQTRAVKVQPRTASIQPRTASVQPRTASHQPRYVNAFNTSNLPKRKVGVRLQVAPRLNAKFAKIMSPLWGFWFVVDYNPDLKVGATIMPPLWGYLKPSCNFVSSLCNFV